MMTTCILLTFSCDLMDFIVSISSFVLDHFLCRIGKAACQSNSSGGINHSLV